MITVHQLRLPTPPIRLPHLQNQVLPRFNLIRTNNVQLVLNPNLIIHRSILESHRKHPLLLQIRLVNARETPRNHRHPTQEPRLERGVLAAGSLAVVPVADDAPSDAGVSVGFRDFRDCGDGVCEEVESLAAESSGAERAFGAGEEVVGDVFEVAAVFVPRAGRGYVVGCAFAWSCC